MKSASDREEIEKFVYDPSISYSPKTFGLKPKYYHNFITKKIFSDKSFSFSKEKHKKTISVLLPIKPKRFRHPLNKTTVLNLSNTKSSIRTDDFRVKTEPSEQYSSNYGKFLHTSLNQKMIKLINNKVGNKKEEICKFYVDILRRVELINFRTNLGNKNSSSIFYRKKIILN